MTPKGVIYIIHFSEPYHHAQHYIGFCEKGNLKKRLQAHVEGLGSRLCAAASASGIELRIVRVIRHATRGMERHMKKHRNQKKYCPVCNTKPRSVKNDPR